MGGLLLVETANQLMFIGATFTMPSHGQVPWASLGIRDVQRLIRVGKDGPAGGAWRLDARLLNVE